MKALVDYFHKNYYPDLDPSEIENHLLSNPVEIKSLSTKTNITTTENLN